METRPLTNAEKAEHNPPFNFARTTATVTTAPPFAFDDTMLMFFPLRADIDALQNLIDSYLNIASGFAYFRAAMPYVFLTVNHYPKMGFAQGNGGWISQDEIIFMVPIEWYERTDEGLKFKAPAQFSPFAFVDRDASQIEGREVYGWPKVQCWLDSVNPAWLENPREHRTLMRMNAIGFRDLYANTFDEVLPVVDVHQAAPPAISTIPPEPNGPLNPYTSIASSLADFNRLAVSTWQWAQHNFQALNRIGISQLSQLFSVSDLDTSVLSNFVGNYINLKQLRDVEIQNAACYQAVTNVEIEMKRFNRGGLLGDVFLAGGDLSGGYEIDIYNYPSIPIVDSLGLEVESTSTNDVYRVKPVLPFWTDMDLIYKDGENIAWRGWDGSKALWRNAEKIEIPEQPNLPAAYATGAGANFQVAEGPFEMPGAVLEVLPLMADAERLNAFLSGGHTDASLANVDWASEEALLPKSLLSQLPPDFGHFEAWGDYVYMVISHLPRIESQSNDFGVIDEDKVTFAVPVKYMSEENELLGTGYVVAYQYSNNDLASTTARELYGYSTISAGVNSASESWLSSQGPFGTTTLLTVEADMPAALVGDQPFEWNKLLEVVEGSVIDQDDLYRWQRTRGFTNTAKAHQSAFHDAQIDAPDAFSDLLGLFSNVYAGTPLREFSFKQYRDAERPNTACYQAFVESGLTIERVYDQREIERPIHVNIFSYPTQPIVDSLGLIVKSTHSTDDGRMDSVQAIRPFYVKADLKTLGAKNLSWRTGTTKWQPLKLDTMRRVDYIPDAVTALADSPECLTHDFKTLHADHRRRYVTAARFREITEIHQPQAILGAVLSREWGAGDASRVTRAKAQSEEISRLEARLARSGADDSERAHMEMRVAHLKTCIAATMPDQVLNTNIAGPMAEHHFPYEERLISEIDPSYWVPPMDKRDSKKDSAK